MKSFLFAKSHQTGTVFGAVLISALSTGCLLADFEYQVTLDTSLLTGHPAGPFALEFQFNDGSGVGDANNSVTLNGFTFGGGAAAVATPSTHGGVSGSLMGTIVLNDSAFFNDFIQGFTPGSALSFYVHQTTQLDSGPIPDQFSFSVLDCHQKALPAYGPADALLTSDIVSDPTYLQSFAGNGNRVPSCGGPGIPLPAPVITVVPEPSSLIGLSGVGLVSWALLCGVRRPTR